MTATASLQHVRPTFDDALDCIARVFGTSKAELGMNNHLSAQPRQLLMHLGVTTCGLRPEEVAKALNTSRAAVDVATQVVSERAAHERPFRQEVEAARDLVCSFAAHAGVIARFDAPGAVRYAAFAEDIKQYVAASFGVAAYAIDGPSRESRVVEARAVTMYLARHLCNMSTTQVARLTNRVDHTTAIAAVKKIEGRIEVDEPYRGTIAALVAGASNVALAAYRRRHGLPTETPRAPQVLPSVDEVLTYVSDAFGVSADALRGPSKQKTICDARAITMYLVRNVCKRSYDAAAESVRRLDHTTATAAIRKIDKQCSADPAYAEFIQRIVDGARSAKLRAPGTHRISMI